MTADVTGDLALQHELVSDLFQLPHSAADWGKYALTREQIEFYHDNGYLTGVRLLDEGQVEQLRAAVSRLMQPDHPGRQYWYEYHSNESADPERILFHALGAWRIEPGVHDTLWNPAFTVAASQLLGGAVRFWHDQLFCKPARHGGVVAWHQDYSYWTRTQPMAHLTCWIGLDDSTRENGCVCYVPRSHTWDLLPITGLAGDMDAIRAVLTPEQWIQFQAPVFAEVKAGECSFHHPLTIHGSLANSTDRPRRAIVLNVVRDGVRSASSEPLLATVPPIPAGQPLAGAYFPLLLDESVARQIQPR